MFQVPSAQCRLLDFVAELISIVSEFGFLSKSKSAEIHVAQRLKRMLDQAGTEMCRSVCDAIRLRCYAYTAERTYVYQAERFVLYLRKQHPLERGEKEISAWVAGKRYRYQQLIRPRPRI